MHTLRRLTHAAGKGLSERATRLLMTSLLVSGTAFATQDAVATILWQSATNGAVQSSPDLANGLLYVGSNDGGLYAFDATTGQLAWKALTGGVVISSPDVANGLVYVGSGDGKLYAFDAVTGQAVWVFATSAAITSSPDVVGGLVYIGSDDGAVYALDALTGKMVWKALTGALSTLPPTSRTASSTSVRTTTDCTHSTPQPGRSSGRRSPGAL